MLLIVLVLAGLAKTSLGHCSQQGCLANTGRKAKTSLRPVWLVTSVEDPFQAGLTWLDMAELANMARDVFMDIWLIGYKSGRDRTRGLQERYSTQGA